MIVQIYYFYNFALSRTAPKFRSIVPMAALSLSVYFRAISFHSLHSLSGAHSSSPIAALSLSVYFRAMSFHTLHSLSGAHSSGPMAAPSLSVYFRAISIHLLHSLSCAHCSSPSPDILAAVHAASFKPIPKSRYFMSLISTHNLENISIAVDPLHSF
jgi:heme/copper-type cytochrome/quinol oxidase subunit 3